MTETTTTAAETATDDTSTTTTTGAETDATTTTPTGDEHDPARAKALIDKLRAESKDAKATAKALADAQARLDAIDAEKLSESERLQKERDEATAKAAEADQRLREQAIRLAVYGQRDTLGLASADLAIAALDRSAVTFDDQGQPTNVADLLTALIEREPILKGTPVTTTRIPSTDGGAGGGEGPSLTADELEAVSATGSTPERYAAVKAVLRGGSSAPVADVIAALSKKG